MQINAEIKMEPEKKIRAEKDLIAIRNKGVEAIKEELSEPQNDNSNIEFLTEKDENGNEHYKTTKIQKIDQFGHEYYECLMEPERDSSGAIVYEDSQKTKPKMVRVPELGEDGKPATDEDGNIIYKPDLSKPFMEEVYETKEITDEDTINQYLQTFVESEAIKVIEKDIIEMSFAGSRKEYPSRKEYKESKKQCKANTRMLLQNYKIGNKFTRFFAPKLVLKKHKENLVGKILEEKKKNYVKIKIQEDFENGKINKNSGPSKVNEQMREVKERAAMHHRLFEAGQAQAHRTDKKKDAFDKKTFISNMQKASYESLAVKLGSEEEKFDRTTEDKIISDNTDGADMPARNNKIMHRDEDNGDR